MASHIIQEKQIADSTDWLKTPTPKLAPVEAALRCHVCKDFFRTPMITSCCHTFCSICIRRCLGDNGLCPECRKPDQEIKLKPNNAIGELVEAFVAARPSLMEIARRPVYPGSPKRKREVEDDEEDLYHASPAKKRAAPERNARSTRVTRSTRSTQMVEDSDGEFELIENETYVPESKPPELALKTVPCPMCGQPFKDEAAIDSHIDNCGGPPKSPRPSVLPFKSTNPVRPAVIRPAKLGATNFSMIKDASLRRKLEDAGLSSMGSKEMMVQRWKEWTLIVNSNWDNEKDPKSTTELLKHMKDWEKTCGGYGASMSMTQRDGTQIKDKNFDKDAWSTKNDTEFKSLIAEARKTSRDARKKAEDEKEKSVSALSAPATLPTASGDAIATNVGFSPALGSALSAPEHSQSNMTSYQPMAYSCPPCPPSTLPTSSGDAAATNAEFPIASSSRPTSSVPEPSNFEYSMPPISSPQTLPAPAANQSYMAPYHPYQSSVTLPAPVPNQSYQSYSSPYQPHPSSFHQQPMDEYEAPPSSQPYAENRDYR